MFWNSWFFLNISNLLTNILCNRVTHVHSDIKVRTAYNHWKFSNHDSVYVKRAFKTIRKVFSLENCQHI